MQGNGCVWLLSTQDGGAYETGVVEYSLGPVSSTTVWNTVDASNGFEFSATGLVNQTGHWFVIPIMTELKID
jgi:hypothetical protein